MVDDDALSPVAKDCNRAAHRLDYASPQRVTARGFCFKGLLIVFGAGGVVANTWFVYWVIRSLHRAYWAHRDLSLDPRAYGREVPPAAITSLQAPHELWLASAVFVIAALFGLLLAIHLLRSTWQLHRSQERGWEGITRYRRYKLFGTAATAATFFWFISETSAFWVAATRHIPIGSGPPIVQTSLLVFGALLPWWWINSRATDWRGQ